MVRLTEHQQWDRLIPKFYSAKQLTLCDPNTNSASQLATKRAVKLQDINKNRVYISFVLVLQHFTIYNIWWISITHRMYQNWCESVLKQTGFHYWKYRAYDHILFRDIQCITTWITTLCNVVIHMDYRGGRPSKTAVQWMVVAAGQSLRAWLWPRCMPDLWVSHSAAVVAECGLWCYINVIPLLCL